MSRIALFLLAAALAGCASLDDRLASAGTPAAIARATADHYVRDVGDESCSVAIVTPSGTVFGNAGSATEHSLFRIASLTKPFLHPMFLKLHAEGRIDLDRSVGEASKLELPAEYRTVTLRDLLQNRSGLPREFLSPWNPLDACAALSSGFFGMHLYSAFDARAEFAKVAGRPWWRRTVGTKEETYSNVGFGLLGTAVEDLAGETHENLLRRELVVPLGLRDTTFAPSPEQHRRLTRPCAGSLPWLVPRGYEVPDHGLGDALWASGGLFSSASDCATAFRAYWPIVDEGLKGRSLEACADDAVFGLLRVKVLPSGRRVLYRAGMIYGGASFVGFEPRSRTVVVILRNVTSWPDGRGFEVMETVLNRR